MIDHIEFKDVGLSLSGKTRKWYVINKRNNAWLATICWSGPWRRYVFLPGEATVWDASCLNRVVVFCVEETQKHKEEKS